MLTAIKFKSFTLIELVIVILIIGVLAAAFIPKIQGVQNQARYVTVDKAFQDFRAAAFMAQANTRMTLKDITNNGCSACACRNIDYLPATSFRDKNLNSLPNSDSCRTARKNALRKIELAADMNIGSLSSLEKDPRGAPYLLDENEEERTSNPCIRDTIKVAGPDGYVDGYQPGSKNDGKNIYINPQNCPGSY